MYELHPKQMMNNDGTKKYAYITFITKPFTYIAGALIFAESVKKTGSLSDIVIMVDSEISDELLNLLKIFYDYIVKIDLTKHNIDKKIEQKDIKSVNLLLLKLYSINLTQYEKILLIDSASIILKYPDYLFTITPPGAVNISVNDEKTLKNYEKWYKKIKHPIDKPNVCINSALFESEEKGLTEHEIISMTFISPRILLLKPTKLIIDVNISIAYIKNIFNSLFKNEWHNIDPIFLGYNGYPSIKELNVIHYTGLKPFILESVYSVEERTKYESFKLWYYYYRSLINKYDFLLSTNILKEPNEISIGFLSELSNSTDITKNIIVDTLKSVENIFNIKNLKNTNYYHINISKEFLDDEIIYVDNYENIKNIKNIFNIKSLNKYIKQKNNSNEYILKKVLKYDEKDIHDILYQWATKNQNISIILWINSSVKQSLTENIIYEKTYELSNNVLKNILFATLQLYSYNERRTYLDDLYKDKHYIVKILLYKTIYHDELVCNNKDLHVFTNTNAKIRILSIFFNNNTLNMFKHNKENNIYGISSNTLSILYYQSLKKWLYSIYDGEHLDNIMVLLNYSNKTQNNLKYYVLDTNIYKNMKKKYISDKLIHIIKLIFTNDVLKNTVFTKIIDCIHNPDKYIIVDGIKFFDFSDIKIE